MQSLCSLNPLNIISVILLILLVMSPPSPWSPSFATGLNANYCKCKYLIARSFFSEGVCGGCALCFWNLYHYAQRFQSGDPSLSGSMSEWEEKFRGCAARIGTNPTYEKDEICLDKIEECDTVTKSFFLDQCEKLYPDLDPPGTVSRNTLQKFKDKINGTQPKLAKFDGTSESHYPLTCPAHHRSYQFTFYMLFGEASSKWNSTETQAYPPWTEELGLPQVAAFMSDESLIFAIERTRTSFESFGYQEKTMSPRRFCNHREDLICVEEEDIKHDVKCINPNAGDCDNKPKDPSDNAKDPSDNAKDPSDNAKDPVTEGSDSNSGTDSPG